MIGIVIEKSVLDIPEREAPRSVIAGKSLQRPAKIRQNVAR